jgi:uncharacterized protein (TIGR02996 family)
MAMFARHPLSQATLEAMASVANSIALGVEHKRTQERLLEQLLERKKAAGRLAAEHGVSRILAISHNLEDAALKVIQAICENLDWDVGTVWVVDPKDNVLRCVETWHGPGGEVAAFEEVTRRFRFSPGVGLPGRVWASGKLVWIPDVSADANLHRRQVAAECGLHGAVGFPIQDGEVRGVLEFFSRGLRQPDDDLIQRQRLRTEVRVSVEPDAAMEAVFLQDIAAHPGDETPWLVFADWLEDQGDNRAPLVRCEGRLQALSRRLKPAWIENVPAVSPTLPPDVSGRFDEAARRVMQQINQEAQRFNHNYISTQHVLLALLHRDFGQASSVLGDLDLSLPATLSQVVRLTPVEPEMVTGGKLPQSAQLRAAVVLACREAGGLGDVMVNPDHLLLGICRSAPCVATRVLQDLGVPPRLVCERLLAERGQDARRWVRSHPEVW